MPHHPWDYDDEAEELDDREDPNPADQDPPGEEDTGETIPCPYCGLAVSEHADLCPHCHSFISFDDTRPQRPWWWIMIVIACVIAILFWLM